MRLVKKPFYWISAHRECSFTFDYSYSFPLVAVGDDDGKALFIFTGDGIHAQEVGDYIYITSGIYKGYHKITEIQSPNFYLTDTDYTDQQLTGNVTFVEDAVFKLGAGFDYPAELYAVLPYLGEESVIARFKPEPNEDGQLVVNISGYINKIFDVINSNDTVTVGSQVLYYNLFNRIVVFIDDAIVSEHRALNSAIDMFELNREYVDTGRSLNGGNLGNHYLSCGTTEEIIISGGYVIQGRVWDNAVEEPLPADFDPGAFDNNDFAVLGG
jgi:hypothetical protein